MEEYGFELKTAEVLIKHAEARANVGDAKGATAFYERAIDKYEKLATKLPERKDEFLALIKQCQDSINSLPEIVNKVNQEKKETNIDPDRQKILEEGLKELDSLVGLSNIKKRIDIIIKLLKIEAKKVEAGLPASNSVSHKRLIFVGNPGTGKTLVTHILAKIYFGLGIINHNRVLEVNRSQLVAPYIGQTALKTRAIIERALGGILLIEQPYELVSRPNDTGIEALDEILQAIEEHRDDLVIVFTGYSDRMEKFLNDNSCLTAKFLRPIGFDDYSDEELIAIFKQLCDENGFTYAKEECLECLKEIIQVERNNKSPEAFDNARFIRNVFEEVMENHYFRTKGNKDSSRNLELDDFKEVLTKKKN